MWIGLGCTFVLVRMMWDVDWLPKSVVMLVFYNIRRTTLKSSCVSNHASECEMLKWNNNTLEPCMQPCTLCINLKNNRQPCTLCINKNNLQPCTLCINLKNNMHPCTLCINKNNLQPCTLCINLKNNTFTIYTKIFLNFFSITNP